MGKIAGAFGLIWAVWLCQISVVNGNTIKHIDDVFTHLHDTREFNGTVLIAKHNKIIYEKFFGYANLEQNTSFSEHSLTNIASVSKTFTALAVMQLIENNQLKLTDELQTYLPDLPYAGVNIKHMLTHTSGLYGEQKPLIRQEINAKGYTNQQIKQLFTQIKPPLNFTPGSDYNYSNTNYTFLALIVEKVSGLSFPTYLQKRVFEPAGMHDTYLGFKRVPESKRGHVMSYYRKPIWLSNELQNINGLDINQLEKQTYSNKYGASQIHTTARDLFAYHQALQGAKLLDEKTMNIMYQPIQLKGGKRYTVNGSSNYPAQAALGWRLADDQSAGRIVFHSGGFRGGRSLLVRNIDKNQVVIILTNNTETSHKSFSFAMRALNQQNYQLDPISLPRVFANQYLDNGIEAAIGTYNKYKNAEGYKPFSDWDFEEIGSELLDKKDYSAAIALHTLYTQQLPGSSFSWSSLAHAYQLSGDVKQAKIYYLKARALNTEDEQVNSTLKMLQELH